MACPQSLRVAQVAEHLENIVPLFRVAPGVCAQSYGVVCATKAKVPTALITRAMQVGHGGAPSLLGVGVALSCLREEMCLCGL